MTFTISKERIWSAVSVNLVELIRYLPSRRVIYIRTIDERYDYSKLGSNEDRTLRDAAAAIEFVVQKVRIELPVRSPLSEVATCPECKRAELMLVGLDRDRKMNVRCRSCGAAGKNGAWWRSNEREVAESRIRRMQFPPGDRIRSWKDLQQKGEDGKIRTVKGSCRKRSEGPRGMLFVW